jgi:hypothetical protein
VDHHRMNARAADVAVQGSCDLDHIAIMQNPDLR